MHVFENLIVIEISISLENIPCDHWESCNVVIYKNGISHYFSLYKNISEYTAILAFGVITLFCSVQKLSIFSSQIFQSMIPLRLMKLFILPSNKNHNFNELININAFENSFLEGINEDRVCERYAHQRSKSIDLNLKFEEDIISLCRYL